MPRLLLFALILVGSWAAGIVSYRLVLITALGESPGPVNAAADWWVGCIAAAITLMLLLAVVRRPIAPTTLR